jgi:hypothetical protein
MPRRGKAPPERPPLGPGLFWDVRPQHLHLQGRNLTFYTRGALATALNRKLVTIRTWESKGILCRSRVKNARGQYLYTREQIEDLIKLAEEEGVLDPAFRNPFSDRFAREAHRIIKRKP